MAPGTAVRRRVRYNGEIRWRGETVCLSEVLVQEPVGFTQIEETLWAVHDSFHPLGILNDRTLTITPAQQWHQHSDDHQAM